MVDIDSEQALREHLDNDEKLLWAGKPQTGIVFGRSDIFLIPFSILWCGFAIFWVIMASQAGFFALFGVPFVLIGLIMVFGRFIIDAKQRENTVYGLTSNRIIIKSGIYRKTIKSLNIRTLSDVEFEEKADGSGTITIGPKNPMNMMNAGMDWWPGTKSNPSLKLIPEVRQVYRTIIELQKAN